MNQGRSFAELKEDDWKEFARSWERRNPPARPSRELQSIYEEFLSARRADDRGANVIFGVTPELRELADQYDLSILCIDQSRPMFEAMTFLMESSPCEVFLGLNWLEVDLPETAGLVIGDGSLGMIPPEDQERLMDVVRRMLIPGGRAVLKAQVKVSHRFNGPREVMDWYRTNSVQESIFTATHKYLDSLYLEDGVFGGTAVQNRYVPELFERGILNREEYEEFVQEIGPHSNYVTYADRDRLEAALEARFAIEKVQYATDYTESETQPIYVLSKEGTNE